MFYRLSRRGKQTAADRDREKREARAKKLAAEKLLKYIFFFIILKPRVE